MNSHVSIPPLKGELHITIEAAKYLDIEEPEGCYVKIRCGTSKRKMKRIPSQNPVWNFHCKIHLSGSVDYVYFRVYDKPSWCKALFKKQFLGAVAIPLNILKDGELYNNWETLVADSYHKDMGLSNPKSGQLHVILKYNSEIQLRTLMIRGVDKTFTEIDIFRIINSSKLAPVIEQIAFFGNEDQRTKDVYIQFFSRRQADNILYKIPKDEWPKGIEIEYANLDISQMEKKST